MSVPSSVLSASRSYFNSRLDREITIVRVGRVDDGQGGYTNSDVVIGTVPMGLAPGMSGQQALEQRLLDRIGNREYFFATFPADFMLEENDVLVDGSVRYNVIGIPNEDITYQVLLRAVVVKDE